ncbi:glycine zipper 2TM domain-containing protein [Altererythrobacter fulvus]|uniref:glycine zipper 2TM domain-containing protein n=1 Tax=Caenibius fulvus TaxID=2126012 RepID=UPI00301B2ABD
MRIALLTVAAAATLVGGCTTDGYRDDGWRGYRNYDYNRPDPRYKDYDAARYYRDGRYYREHNLNRNDRIYRGRDGKFYCRRSDGTTGLVVGALAGGTLGSAIAPGDSEVLGALIGGAVGALIGSEIDKGQARCR